MQAHTTSYRARLGIASHTVYHVKHDCTALTQKSQSYYMGDKEVVMHCSTKIDHMLALSVI